MGTPSPITNRDPKIVSDLLEIIIILNKKSKYASRMESPPINPYSSTIIAKIKSDEDWGKKFFCTLLPGPNPFTPPVAIAILAFSI